MSISALKAYLNELNNEIPDFLSNKNIEEIQNELQNEDYSILASNLRLNLDMYSAYVPLDNDTIKFEWEKEILNLYNKYKRSPRFGAITPSELVDILVSQYKIGVNKKLKTRNSIAFQTTESNLRYLIEKETLSSVIQDLQNKLDTFNKNKPIVFTKKLYEFHIYSNTSFNAESLVGVLFLSNTRVPGNAFSAVRSTLDAGPKNIISYLMDTYSTTNKDKNFKAYIQQTFTQQIGHTAFGENVSSQYGLIGSTPGSITTELRSIALAGTKPLSPTELKNTIKNTRQTIPLSFENEHRLYGNSSSILQKTSDVFGGDMLFTESLGVRRTLVYTGSSKRVNQLLRVKETKAGAAIRAKFKTFFSRDQVINREASKTPRQCLEEAMVVAFSEGKKYKYKSRKKVAESKNIDKKIKTSNKAKATVGINLKDNKVIKPEAKNISVTLPIVENSSNTSLGEILSILQNSLEMKVKENMKTPRLINRTGRFANSVKVNNVSMGSTGLVTITYRYQTFPYQTFEPGYEQGSRDRDPRSLIATSIRELVAPIIGNKFRAVRIGGAGSLSRPGAEV